MEWNEATVQNGGPMLNDEIIGYDTCVYHSRIWASSYAFDIITFVSQLSLQRSNSYLLHLMRLMVMEVFIMQ